MPPALIGRGAGAPASACRAGVRNTAAAWCAPEYGCPC